MSFSLSFLFLFSSSLSHPDAVEAGKIHHAQGESKGLGCFVEGEMARAEGASRRRKTSQRSFDAAEVTARGGMAAVSFRFFFQTSSPFLGQVVFFRASNNALSEPLFESLWPNGRARHSFPLFASRRESQLQRRFAFVCECSQLFKCKFRNFRRLRSRVRVRVGA